jgi:hypothetical protein
MSEMFGQLDMAMRVGQSITVTDNYASVEDGRVTKLARTFDKLGGNTRLSGSHAVAGELEQDSDLESELEGTTVAFDWDEEDETYGATFPDGDGDEELLVDLREDMDLAGFLPSGDVAEGDSWSIEPEAVRALLAPGGNLKLKPVGDLGDMSASGQFSQSDLIGELEGKFQATFGGTREEGDAQVAVIRLDLEVRSARDLSAMASELAGMMSSKLPPNMEVEVSALDVEYELEAEGELLWDVQAGLVHALHLSGQMRQIVDTTMTMKQGTKSQTMETSQTFTGTQTFSLTTSR